MNTIKTELNYYYFNLSKRDEKEKHKELWKTLQAQGLKCFTTHGAPAIKESCKVTLELNHLFENQWNGETHRLFDWYEGIFPNADIKEGYYLTQTDEMKEVRRNNVKCQYCGHTEPSAKGNVFCPKCLGGKYLSADKLYLTRMTTIENVGSKDSFKALSPAEKDHLLPRYEEAQLEGRKKINAKEIERLKVNLGKNLANYQKEYDGKMWLLERHFTTDNVIFYTHRDIFTFGWRDALPIDEEIMLREKLTEFPFEYEIKTTG